jgi:hypothetical protein
MRMTIPVPGRLGAAFLSSSLTVLLFGVLVACQGGLLRPLLALLPLPTLGGLICLSYLFWLLFWLGLSCLLGSRQSIGTLPIWTAIFLGATLLSIILAEVSFMLRALMH